MKLLILSCSATKADHPARAIDLYDGPAFRTLRAWTRNANEQQLKGLAVWVLSAEYGLIPHHQELEPYDRRMSDRRADELRPEVSAKLRDLVGDLEPSELFLMMGLGYLRALPPDVIGLDGRRRVLFPEGGIGEKLGALSSWLKGVA